MKQYRNLSLHLAAVALCALGATAAGCEPRTPQPEAAVALEAAPAPQIVDSIFPIEEELHRFRAALPDSSTRLEGGAASRHELVARFVAALEAGDRTELAALTITPEEFAYLYYPHTRYTHRPYELGPALVWFQLENYGSRGLTRALARYGGRPIGAVGHACHPEPEIAERNRVWSGCVVRRIDPASGDTVSLSLFGAILERDGAFKFINYGNRL